jgi:hypothetical protein
MEDSNTEMNTLDATLISSKPAMMKSRNETTFWSGWDMGQHSHRLI